MDPVQAKLRETSDRVRELDEAASALSLEGKPTERMQALKERAELIANLTKGLRQIDGWQLFDSKLHKAISGISRDASESLDHGGGFVLSTLLISKGSRGDSKDQLQVIIDDFFPGLDS